MSCQPTPTFRLLNARIGWDPRTVSGLAGLHSIQGLVLAPVHGEAESPAEVLPWFFPPRLALGATRCEWLLAPRRGCRLLRFTPCTKSACFEGWGPTLVRPSAVALDCYWIVVADAGTGSVLVLDRAGNIRASMRARRPRAVAIAPWREILVAAGHRVLRFGLGGDPRGELPGEFPNVVALRAFPRGPDPKEETPGEIWVAWWHGKQLMLSRFDRRGKMRHGRFHPPSDTAPSGIRTWDRRGFCWVDAKGPIAPCVDWNGCPARSEISDLPVLERQGEGALEIVPLDGGDVRTVWHRIRLDAEVPPGTEVSVEVATLDGPDEPVSQWQPGPAGRLDFLVQQPPGRYLALKLTLRGDSRATPRVRQIRIDYPRVTSADLLPAVYREDPRATDFTERFTSLFDAELEVLDQAIEKFPVTLSAHATSEAYLPWLGSLIGLTLDDGWSAPQRRTLISEAPGLFARRGTPWSLGRVLEIATGERPAIVEEQNPFGALARPGRAGGARLSETRLFGKNVRRFRLDRSAIGGAALRSYGDPDADPLLAACYRFTVGFSPALGRTPEARSRLTGLVMALKPAHTVAQVRFGGSGFVLGTHSMAGVDSALGPAPAPTLGQSTWLSRITILWPSARARGPGLPVDFPVVGVGTSL